MIDFESFQNTPAEEMAVEIRRTHQGNCCQAVVAALTRDPKMVEAGGGFGGGMGNMQGPCGAMIGAVIAAGAKTRGTASTRFSRQIFESFRENSGAVVCRELKGIDSGKVLCSCDDCVRNAVRAYRQVFGE